MENLDQAVTLYMVLLAVLFIAAALGVLGLLAWLLSIFADAFKH